MPMQLGIPDPDRPFEAPLYGNGDGDRLLCRSPNFTVRCLYETVMLEGRHLDAPVVVGDFYGNPSSAAIGDDERWCVVVGCGLIAYRLAPPWLDYSYDYVTDQWWEHGRDPAATLWLSEVEADEDGMFMCKAAGENEPRGRRYLTRPDDRSIQVTE